MTALLQSIDARGVATLTLNRPEKRNALDGPLIALLRKELHRLDERSDVRIIAIRGAGDHFCAGGDIDWMMRVAQRSSSANEEDAMALAQLLHALDTLSTPTIALAHGAIVGGGIGLLACCDIVIASDDACFSLNEVRLGVIPAVIAPYLIRAVGMRQIRRYALSAETLSAEEACAIGLVHLVRSGEELRAAYMSLVDDLLRGAPGAQADAKKFFARCAGRTIDADLLREAACRLAARRATAEAQEGFGAFLTKRSPDWAGTIN